MKRNTSAVTSNSTSITDGSSVVPGINEADIIQYAPNSAQHPVTLNDKGRAIRGTALAVYMGYKNSSIDWVEGDGEDATEKSVAKLALVFALRLTNGSYKNTVVKTNYAIAPGSQLDGALKGLGITPEYETIEVSPDHPLHGTMFGVSEVLNIEKLQADLETVKGLGFLVEVENKVSKGKKYYNDIDLSTLEPYLDKSANHMRLRKSEECDISSLKIKFD